MLPTGEREIPLWLNDERRPLCGQSNPPKKNSPLLSKAPSLTGLALFDMPESTSLGSEKDHGNSFQK
jgi:hypothetical protein